MIRSLGATLQDHLLNLSGLRIKEKVVVLESDDWGSVRIPSKKAYNALKQYGLALDSNPYNRFDSLETSEDIQAFIEVLTCIKDHNGNYPIVTTNFIVGNPNFEQIRESGFSHYAFEKFTETYKRSKSTEGSWSLIQQAIANQIFMPQFHGREHVNVIKWLNLLMLGDPRMTKAFDEGVFSIDIESNHQRRNNLMATLDFTSEYEKSFCYRQLEEGTRIFNEIFGFTSESFIAPANVWDEGAEQILQGCGVKYIQGFRGQKVPRVDHDGYQTLVHNFGDRSPYGHAYLVRNCYFEPSTLPNYNWIGSCTRKIEAAFFWKKPAVISLHRLNFIGSLSLENRVRNLNLLKELLKIIVKRWPDVVFLSSNQLGKLIDNNECVA